MLPFHSYSSLFDPQRLRKEPEGKDFLRKPGVRFGIVEETKEYIVLDKPPFLQVHPKKSGGRPTLWDGLRDLLAFELINGARISFINRLDRETSGIVLAATDPAQARLFYTAMEARAFVKEYTAIVWGWPPEETFTVDAPIVRECEEFPSSRIYLKRCVHPKGASSLTRFRVEKRFEKPGLGPFSIVKAFPVTGRTHQIRVHLAHVGFPIVGDKIYGPDEGCYLEFYETGWTPSLARVLLLGRHALHASRLTLKWGDAFFDWASPLPSDLAEWLEV